MIDFSLENVPIYFKKMEELQNYLYWTNIRKTILEYWYIPALALLTILGIWFYSDYKKNKRENERRKALWDAEQGKPKTANKFY